MKVYTHYYKLENYIEIRWRTLLQFGNSWEVIGSVVMKNPGSASISDIQPIDDQYVIDHLSVFDQLDNLWYEFTDDDTMRKVGVLFASYYGLDNVQKLQGVIQVFNLFYIRNADLQTAKGKYNERCLPANFSITDEILEYDIEHLIEPVYLGFGDLAFSKEFQNNARRYFDQVIARGHSADYLNRVFEENPFLHPQYLCGHGCNRDQSVYIRGKFKIEPLTEEQIRTVGVPLPAYAWNKQDHLKLIQTFKESFQDYGLETYNHNSNDNKTIRFKLPLDLQVTITACGKGYIGIRHTNLPKGRVDYNNFDYTLKEQIDKILIEENGFGREDVQAQWIGVRTLNSFSDLKDIVECIKRIYNELAPLVQTKED